MEIRTDPMYAKCGEKEETVYHLLGRCSAMMMVRYFILGSHLMDITELQQVQPHTLLRFAKASKRFVQPFEVTVISGLRIGSKLITRLQRWTARCPPRR